MLKTILTITATLLLYSVAADNRVMYSPTSSAPSAVETAIDSGALLAPESNAAEETVSEGAGPEGVSAQKTRQRPKTKVTVKTVAADKDLVLEENIPDSEVEVMICGRERIGTGSRLSRRVCRSVQQLERESQVRKAQVSRSSNRFQRQPPRIGARSAKTAKTGKK